jgi:hypothetical protein
MESCRHFNEDPNVEGEMSVEFDIGAGHIRSLGSGFWSEKQALAFFADWQAIIHRVHAAGQSVSALVDLSEVAVQKFEVADIIARVTVDLYVEGDAVAMLVPTSLAKMQMRRVLDARYHDFFISRGAAETWLRGRLLRVEQHAA